MNFLDTETSSLADLKRVGAWRYANHPSTRLILVTWAVDDGPVWDWCPYDSPIPPKALIEALSLDLEVCWNASFDRLILQTLGPRYGLPSLPLENFVCAQAQGSASLFPADLAQASRIDKRGPAKLSSGKELIQIFSITGDPPTTDHPRWNEFREYGVQDVKAMRHIWQTSAPMVQRDWEDYWVSERINDRGLPVNRDLCAAVMPLMETFSDGVNDDLEKLTCGGVTKHTQSKRITGYLQLMLPSFLVNLMVTKRDEEGDPTNYGSDSKVLDAIMAEAEINDIELDADLVEFISTVRWGRNVSGNKLGKMYHMTTKRDPMVRGSYVLNGAGKTGRFSARGVQTQNMPRDALPEEAELIKHIGSKGFVDCYLARNGLSMGYTASRLVRPAIHAPAGKTLVWCDLSQIEARVLPWLSGDARAEKVLDIFRSGQDIYTLTAQDIYDIEIGPNERQAGKVATLALGFGGGVNAYQVMARNYGLKVTNLEARAIRDAWRDANPWARSMWKNLETQFTAAMQAPEVPFKAGKITYLYKRDVMRGTVFCILPCGRVLSYPEAKLRKRELPDGREDWSLSHRDRHTHSGQETTWAWTYGGSLAENITQATAASLLRRALRMLDHHSVVVGHSHDEILACVDVDEARYWEGKLEEVMTDVPEWAPGLPIEAKALSCPYYTKTIE